MKVYTHKVIYTGLLGTKKELDLSFHLTTPEIIELENELTGGEDFMTQVQDQVEKKKYIELMEAVKKFILKAYCVVDLENDIIDKSEATVERFHSSVAFATLFEDCITKDGVIEELMAGITSTIEERMTAEQKLESNKLKEEYAQRIGLKKLQNDNKPEVVDEVAELRARLAVLEGGE